MARLAAPVLSALLLFGPLQIAQCARIDMTQGQNATDTDESAGLACTDYCVQCQDGSSVWYGRSQNWWKAGASLTLGSVGIAAAASGVGAVGVALGAAGAGVLGVSQGVESAEETHTHWTGNLPTTGLSCERVDVVKFSRAGQCQAQYLMQKSQKRFGRVWNNMLKPYDEKNQLKMAEGFTEQDNTVYRTGCKIVKASGMTGSWKQFTSNFQSYCASSVTKGVTTCSMHSRLCGSSGGVSGVIGAKSADECLQQCQSGQAQLMCPAY